MKLHTIQRLIWIAPLAMASVALAADDPAAASETPNPMSWDWVPYVSSLVVFGAAFFILSRTAWPKISKGLEEREGKIRQEIENAEKARKDAEAALAEYQRSLAEARTEAGKIVEQATLDQKKVAAELRSKTEAELNALRDSARRDIEAAKQQAVGEIYEHMSNVATSIAGKILRKEISADDQRALVEESLNQLATTSSN